MNGTARCCEGVHSLTQGLVTPSLAATQQRTAAREFIALSKIQSLCFSPSIRHGEEAAERNVRSRVSGQVHAIAEDRGSGQCCC